jgi:hypothetical protein
MKRNGAEGILEPAKVLMAQEAVALLAYVVVGGFAAVGCFEAGKNGNVYFAS